ncbi:MAG: OmpA family protein [Deltaproteobacteria bacterium]|nr:OmpA family protein [Deltaproteobacteria bacterium]
MPILSLVAALLLAAEPSSGADPGCVSDADRPSFCEYGTAWSAGPCDGGEYLVCEPTHEAPNILPTVFLGVAACGLALWPMALAAAAAEGTISSVALLRSLEPGLNGTTADRFRLGAGLLCVASFGSAGTAVSMLITGLISAFWLWRQGLEVIHTREGEGRRVTLYAVSGLGHSAPLASYRTDRENDCHDELRRQAAEDHFHKVAEIWAYRNRSLISALDPWKGMPRMPDRTPPSARMTAKKCQAQLEGGAARVKRALVEVAAMRKEVDAVRDAARDDLRECAKRSSVCTCNCDSRGGQGGTGGQGGAVSLGPGGSPTKLMQALTDALGPETPVTERDDGVQVALQETVLFDFDKDVLTPAARATLSKVAKVLAAHPQVHVIVEGHTSLPGEGDYNLDLSKRRVKAVVEGLAGLGVARSRLSTGAFGETRPEVKTDSEEGRNRRVILRLK